MLLIWSIDRYVIPMLTTSNVNYEFVCCRDDSYDKQMLRHCAEIREIIAAINRFNSRLLLLPMQRISCRKSSGHTPPPPSANMLKYLLKNDAEYTTVIGLAEMTSACVEGGFTIERRKAKSQHREWRAWNAAFSPKLGRSYKLKPHSFSTFWA